MDAYESILTKLDVREFSKKRVPGEVRRKILEAARLTGSSMNSQHWRFILIQDRPNLKKLAEDSTSGKWVAAADFAILILVNPKIPGYTIDGGRALQDMELAAWSLGVVSGLFTGVKQKEIRGDFAVPPELEISGVLGFGYPRRKVLGRKNRKPIEDIVFLERYGNRFDAKGLE